ncbi:MAG: hypothetical protein AB7F41_00385 [Methylocystis sp.]|uniref:cysteine dioxygenase family protein n=1 Tax=Methylocystis sp. TaxID=1911079 RepID=UPI003D0EC0E6
MIAANTADSDVRVIERDPVPPALRRFIWDIQSMVELAESEREILLIGRDLLTRLLATDDWLPTVFTGSSPAAGQQFQIFRGGLERFSVVSTVLAGGACATISQPAIWEIAGVLRGAVNRRRLDGCPENGAQAGASRLLQAKTLDVWASGSGEAVELCNALDDRPSIMFHVYGGDISRLTRRSGASDGSLGAPIAGYANADSAPPYDIFSIQSEIRD